MAHHPAPRRTTDPFLDSDEEQNQSGEKIVLDNTQVLTGAEGTMPGLGISRR